MMNTIQKKEKSLLPSTTTPAPWFVFPNGEGGKRLNFVDLSNLQLNNFLRTTPHEIRGKRCVASMHGWVIMIQKGHGCLWNLSSQQIISLPPFEVDCGDGGVWILLPPPLNRDFMILLITKTLFLTWQLGDCEWTTQGYTLGDVDQQGYHSITNATSCANGNIYARTNRGEIAIIERGACGILSIRLFNFQKLCFESSCGYDNFVESCGEVYLVSTYFVGESNVISISSVTIWRMDFSKELIVKAESLEDRIFFISNNGSASFSASKLGLKGNCIFIPYQNDLHVFDLEDESRSVYLPCPNLLSPSFTPFWFVPNNSENGQDINADSTKQKQVITTDYVEDLLRLSLIDLPGETLQLIAMRLLPIAEDYMNYRSVCKTFRSSAPPIRLSTQYPLLMSSNKGKRRCSFSDPVKNITYNFDIPEMLGAKIHFSKDGWLLMSKEDGTMLFFSPFTRVSVELPVLPQFFLTSLSFSSAPTSPDCVVFGVCCAGNKTVGILLLRLGDANWTREFGFHEEFFFPSSNSPVFHNGSFYCLGVKGYLGIYRMTDRSWTVLPTPRPCCSIHQNYLLVRDGELTSVFLGRKGKYVHAYRLDQLNIKWQILSNLEDQMLFVSKCASTSAKVLSEGIKNRIYFPISFRKSRLFYSLQTNRWHSPLVDHYKEDLYNTSEVLNCTWIQHTLE